MKLINFFLFITFFFFTWGQLGRLSLPDEPVFGYIYEVFLVLSLLMMGWKYSLHPFKKHIPVYRAIIIFFIWILFTFSLSLHLYNLDQNIVAGLYLARLIIYYLFLIYGLYHFEHNRMSLGLISIMITCGILLPSLVQYFLYQDFGNLAYLGWDPHQYRLVGLFFDPPITVSILGLLQIFAAYLYSRTKKLIYLATVVVLLIMIFLTYSRGGYLALIMTGIAFFLRQYKWKYIATGIGILLLGFILLPKSTNESINLLRTTSIFTRVADYEVGWKIYIKHPVTGVGYNHIRYEKDRFTSIPDDEPYNPSHAAASLHSSYLIILVTSGLVGLILYLYLLYEVARIHMIALYGSIFLGVISIFDNVLLHPFILFLFFFLITYVKVIHPSDSVQSSV